MDEDLYYESNDEEGGDDESQNRTFLYLIAAMVATLVCALAAVAGYMMILRPQQERNYIAANETAVAYNATLMAGPAIEQTMTPEGGEEIALAPTYTPTQPPTETPTKTPVVQPPTKTPTATPLVTETPPTTPTSAVTATKTATPRSASARSTATPDEELPQTGVGSGVGLVVLGAGLVAVLFIARRLRLSRG
ncbi:MAG: LPXTG cell wall anchor domain-containing protein [Thermoflexales bacterium]|nr:LPXTG cell wall anchor domain-containing protein [Thermoflexales bacterium]